MKLENQNDIIIENRCFTGLTEVKCKFTETKNGTYKAKVDLEAPDVLYVNNRQYRMSRYPAYDENIRVLHGYAEDAEKYAENGAYLHVLQGYLWGGFHYTYREENGQLIKEGGWQNNRPAPDHKQFKFIENIRKESYEPGEWYYRDGTLFVCFYPEDINGKIEYSNTESVLSVIGCRNITVRNCTFMGTARTFMKTRETIQRSDWAIYRNGAVYIEDSYNCRFENCSFTDIGGNAIFVNGNNELININKCHFYNIGASAIAFCGKPDCTRKSWTEFNECDEFEDYEAGPCTQNYPKNCFVENCLIHKIGTVEKQSAGVEISLSEHITVKDCSIYDTSRAAINISEGSFGGHDICGCDIFDTVKETADHGCFNSWGRDRFWKASNPRRYALLDAYKTTEIHNNRFRCDHGWDIDLDDGSSNYHIYKNLCLKSGIKLREGFFRTCENNITVGDSIHMHVWYPNSGDIVKRNIVFDKYRPIMMDYSNSDAEFDYNIMYSDCEATHCEELSEQTQADKHSIKLKIKFKNPSECDYTVETKEVLDMGFENFPMEFGVRDPELKKQSRTPEIPKFLNEEATDFGFAIPTVITPEEKQ